MSRPNFLIILADDLGFSDLGCYGSEIRTPNLDKLAMNGIRFTNCKYRAVDDLLIQPVHSAAACSPTRSMIMTGTDNHIAGVGHMGFWTGPEGFREAPGYEGYINDRVATVAELLRDAGYHTLLSGKWHLGHKDDCIPSARGFDKSFSMLGGCHNHYAWEPQFGEPDSSASMKKFSNFQPTMYSKKDLYVRDKERLDVPANFPLRPDGFYSTDAFTDQLLTYLDERVADPDLSQKPWYAYFPFTAPHWPLQAPREVREKYKGRYDGGPEVLRQQRLKSLKEKGLVPPDTKAHPIMNPLGIRGWDDFTPEERQKSARAMEAYAAMVECIDTAVGRIVKRLEQDGELDNTFIMFLSDNGAEGASYEASPFLGEAMMDVIDTFYDNSLDNIGEPNSFVWYGTFWAQAATAPSRLYKMFTTQGGIRVPCILHYPPLLKSKVFSPGTISEEFGTVMDITPTMLELAGVTHPAQNGQKGKFHEKMVEPMRGVSWVDWLNGKAAAIHAQGKSHGWELHGRAALRVGNWKMLYIPPPYGKGSWELFDLSVDPGETTDLAERNPILLEQMKKCWDQYIKETGTVWAPRHATAEEIDEMGDTTAWMKTSGFPF